MTRLLQAALLLAAAAALGAGGTDRVSVAAQPIAAGVFSREWVWAVAVVEANIVSGRAAPPVVLPDALVLGAPDGEPPLSFVENGAGEDCFRVVLAEATSSRPPSCLAS